MELSPEKWQRVKALVGAALELDPQATPTFLEKACPETDIRYEVERLLACRPEMRSNFLSEPLFGASSTSARTFDPGSFLSDRFRITRFIAAGGMGEVYEAEDTELKQRVAIKTVRPSLASQPRFLQNFLREVRAARRVTHPNICRIHDLFRHHGSDRDVVFFSMELLSGETLAQRLEKANRMTIQEALPIVIDMAEALAAAHEAGVLHRDFKPSNVILVPREQPEGFRAVVTDFGLALEPDQRDEKTGDSAGSSLTGPWGTLAYMSPEQLDGQNLGAASDIYSLGLVIYRMVTGASAFEDRTVSTIRLRRSNTIPRPPRSVVPDLDPAWEEVIRTCLQREPVRRFGSAIEVAKALQSAAAAESKRPLLRFAGYAVTLLMMIVATIPYWETYSLSPPHVRGYTQLTHDGKNKFDSLFADGQRLYFKEAFSRGDRIVSVPKTGGEPSPIALPPNLETARLLDLSPTRGELLLAVKAASNSDFEMWAFLLPRGPARRVGTIAAETAAWSLDGREIAFTKNNDDRIWLANADGTQLRTLMPLGKQPEYPRWSPNGQLLRFALIEPGTRLHPLWEVRANGKGLRPVLPKWNSPYSDDQNSGCWIANGQYYVFQTGLNNRFDIWAIPDRNNLLHPVNPEPVRLSTGPMGLSGAVSGADDGLFAIGEQVRGELMRYDPRLGQLVSFLGGISARWISFSRDGQHLAYVSYPEGTLWRANADGSQAVALSSSSDQVDGVSWSPDGKWILCRSRILGKPYKIEIVPAEGGPPKQLFSQQEHDEAIPSWSSDAKRIVFGDVPASYGIPEGNEAIHVYDLSTQQLTTLPGSNGLWTARWSPDGHYVSALTIRDPRQLVIFDFKTGKWRGMNADGVANNVVWSHDGRYIYFDRNLDGIYRLRIAGGRPEKVVDTRALRLTGGWNVGLARDDSILTLRDAGITEIYALDVEWP